MGSNLKDIAKELGLSVSTVSRVINNKGYISPETRQRVMETVEKYHYSPNQVARSLRTQSTNTVGMMVPDIGEYFSAVIKGIDEVLSERGYSMILMDTNESIAKEQTYAQLLYEKRIDGLILATVSHEAPWLDLYKRGKIPVLFFDNDPNLRDVCNLVLLDNIRAGQMAVEHLYEQGHRNIAVICGNQSETTAIKRAEGFRSAMLDKQLPIDEALVQSSDYQDDAGYQCMQTLLKNRAKHPFSAVFATSYKLSCGAIHAIKDAGLRYPEDIALIGFDIVDESRLFSPSITSIVQPSRKIGRVLASRLLLLMEQSNPEFDDGISQHIMIEPILKVGESSQYIATNS